jgi:threonine/homoserine/homoserine lactone efflux protein
MKSFDIIGYMIFAFVTSITPGPNNYLLFSYGKSFGLKDSGSLMFGILSGFLVLLYIAGYGVGEFIMKSPVISLILKIASSVWLFYLAIALSRLNIDDKKGSNSKIGFSQGFMLQFVNPKAWIIAIAGAGAFLPDLDKLHLSVFVFAISFGAVGIPCMITWISFGDVMSRLIKSEKANHILSFILFILMVLSIVTIWL